MTLISTGGAPPPLPTKISHPAHREHRLKLKPTGQAKFMCNGCHEHGTGADRYTCKPCDFDLHADCAVAEGTPLVHELLPKNTFKLRLKAPRSRERCSACGTHAQGIHYYCEKKDLYLHPCCAKLPLRIPLGGELYFELREKVSHCCTRCRKGGGVRDFWFYRSSCKTMYLHVSCVKELFLLPTSGAGGSAVVNDENKLALYVKETASHANNGSGKAGKNFDALCDILKTVVSIILAVITGNPFSVASAVVDLGFTLTKLRI